LDSVVPIRPARAYRRSPRPQAAPAIRFPEGGGAGAPTSRSAEARGDEERSRCRLAGPPREEQRVRAPADLLDWSGARVRSAAGAGSIAPAGEGGVGEDR
jgi:hypothetical protein